MHHQACIAQNIFQYILQPPHECMQALAPDQATQTPPPGCNLHQARSQFALGHLEGLQRQHDALLVSSGAEQVGDIQHACRDLLHAPLLCWCWVECWQAQHSLGQIVRVDIPCLRLNGPLAICSKWRCSGCGQRSCAIDAILGCPLC